MGDGDGFSFVPVSSERLAPEPKPRQPASSQAAWILEASPWTCDVVDFKSLKRGNRNSSPLLGVYCVPGESPAVVRSVLTNTVWVDTIITFLQMKISSLRKVTSPA